MGGSPFLVMILVDLLEITAIFADSQQIPPFHKKIGYRFTTLLFHILMYVEIRTIPELKEPHP